MNSRTNHQEEEIPPHEHSQVDVRTITAPVFTMVSVIGFIIWLTFSVFTEKQNLKDMIHAEVDDLRIEYEGNMRQMKEIVDRLKITLDTVQTRQLFVLENLWTKTDYTLFCVELEKRNPNFDCPSYNELKDLGLLETKDINSSTDALLKRMREELEQKFPLWNKEDPRHSPDASVYQNGKAK